MIGLRKPPKLGPPAPKKKAKPVKLSGGQAFTSIAAMKVALANAAKKKKKDGVKKPPVTTTNPRTGNPKPGAKKPVDKVPAYQGGMPSDPPVRVPSYQGGMPYKPTKPKPPKPKGGKKPTTSPAKAPVTPRTPTARTPAAKAAVAARTAAAASGRDKPSRSRGTNDPTHRIPDDPRGPQPDPPPGTPGYRGGGPQPDPPPRGGSPAPVGGGSGSTGGTTGAAGSALGGASGTDKPTGSEAIFAPILQQMKDQAARDADLRAKAETNLRAYQDWLTGTLNTSQTLHNNAVTQSQQATSAALKGIGGNLNKYGGGASTMFAGDVASGGPAADAAQGLRAGAMVSDTQMSDSVARAIAARVADNAKIGVAQVGGLRSDFDARFAKRDEDRATQNTNVQVEIAKARLADQQAAAQARIDQQTADALAGEKTFDRNLKTERFNLDVAKAKADQSNKNRAYNLAVKKLNKTSSKDSLTADKLLKLGLERRAAAEKSWEAQQKRTGKPFDHATSVASFNRAVVLTARALYAANPQGDPQDVLNVLDAVYGRSTRVRAGL